jgi:rhamnose transport system substrate-binding protein
LPGSRGRVKHDDVFPRVVAISALTVAIVAGTAHATESSHPREKRYTVAFVGTENLNPRIMAMGRGGRAAAKQLGMRYILSGSQPQTVSPLINGLIARHVDAIATEGFIPEMKPILNKVHVAGIRLLSSGDDIAAVRDLWVSQSDPVAYADALADALAAQMKGEGDYVILGEGDQFPIANQWEQIIKRYVAKTYPQMTLEGIVTGTGAGDPAEVASVADYIAAHPQLRGVVAVTPTEAYMAAEGIEQAGDIGKVFSSGNGGSDFNDLLPGFVRSGAAQLVFGGNPVKVGYLTVWAAHYLLTGHTFKAGLYHVGGPIGSVYYHAKRQELRLGQPLTITKANVEVFANQF